MFSLQTRFLIGVVPAPIPLFFLNHNFHTPYDQLELKPYNTNELTMTLKKRSSSTAGLSEHLRPLPKGMACLACSESNIPSSFALQLPNSDASSSEQRKVRCSGTYPACSSCLRTAKFANLSPESVVCQYIGVHEDAPERADSPAVEKKQRKVIKEEPITHGLTKAGLMGAYGIKPLFLVYELTLHTL